MHKFVLFSTILASVSLGDGRSRNYRQPGKLLLNMLIKDEAEHLERSLPKWAPLIDYWIVGIGRTCDFSNVNFTESDIDFFFW